MPSKEKIFESLLQLMSLELIRPVDLEIDWSDQETIHAFVNQAERSGVASWCFYRLLQNPENKSAHPELMARLKQRYLAVLIDNQQKLKLFREIEKILASHDIPVALLKGMAMAFTVYPEEALRPMGDLDILVPEHLVLKARDVLLSAGCQSVHIPMSEWHEQHNAHIRAMRLPPHKYLIEIHSKLYATGSRLQPAQMAWEQSVVHRSTAFGNFPVLDYSLMVYHLASHLYYGYMMGGVRLGWLVDIAMVFEKAGDVAVLMEALLKINPGFNKELLITVGWATRLMRVEKRQQLEKWESSFTDFPEIKDFLEQQDAEVRHRWIVLKNLWRTPGINNKVKGAFYQLFPSREYMAHYYGVNGGKGLWKAYLKRLGEGRMG
ncbi:hypothetical protein JCM15548_14291 [Geofilum rubicundum JCM 15548]|uniref:Uncharacterized protein n=2 Tax=Geofilum TaxID=1236988 RepID=A0A0E9M2X7_9BACT|nr:hypothetical protein JCM15548_14291 [Geofilum rubicundum JCM 15548]